MVFLKEFFKEVDFENNPQTTKSMQHFQVGKEIKDDLCTVLQAKSHSDVMFSVYKVTMDLESIDRLCINPILRIGLIHK